MAKFAEFDNEHFGTLLGKVIHEDKKHYFVQLHGYSYQLPTVKVKKKECRIIE